MKRRTCSASFLLGFAMVIGGILTARAQESAEIPSTSAWKDLGVVRVDHRNTRLFVVPLDDVLRSRESASTYLMQIAELIATELPNWKTDWSVSFFSSADVAGYKTDFTDVKEDREGWERAYLAEFDRRTRRLSYFPLNPKKVKYDVIEFK